MIFTNPFIRGGLVLIEDSVITAMADYRQHRFDRPEAGGILMGFRRDKHLQIVSATTPHSSDDRSLFSFVRKDPAHQKAASNFWVANNQKGDYLGEWHTHPEMHPKPSAHDLCEWQIICKGRRVAMIFIIMGIEKHLWVGLGTEKGIKICMSKSPKIDVAVY